MDRADIPTDVADRAEAVRTLGRNRPQGPAQVATIGGRLWTAHRPTDAEREAIAGGGLVWVRYDDGEHPVTLATDPTT